MKDLKIYKEEKTAYIAAIIFWLFAISIFWFPKSYLFIPISICSGCMGHLLGRIEVLWGKLKNG